MNLRSVDLNLFLVFDAIYRERSISRAAEKLHLAQPTVSNALARLRSRFDDPLFTRSAGGMVPTARAQSLAQPVHEALDLLERSVRSTSRFDYANSTRRFVVSVEDYGEAVILPRFLEGLGRAAPKVTVCVRSEPRETLGEELRDGRVDFCISYFALPDVDFHNECVLTDVLTTLARPRPQDADGEWLDLDTYVASRHVVLTPRSHAMPMIDLALSKRGLRRHVAVEVPHFNSMPLLVAASDLLCTLPRRMARLYANHFALTMHAFPMRAPAFPIYLTWHAAADADLAHRWLRNGLIDFCQNGSL